MGSSSQAIRYPVVTTSARNINALNRVLADLCTRSNLKDGVALTLRWLVEKEARDLSGEDFARFMDHLYECITTFLDSNEVSENLGALRAIYELIDVTISENVLKVAKFSNYIRAAFETKRDPKILVFDSKVLGHLARSGGAMTADEVKVALEWLRGERIEYCRFAAVLILKEMAEMLQPFSIFTCQSLWMLFGLVRGIQRWLFEENLSRYCVRAIVLLKIVRQGGVFSGIIEYLRLPKMDWGEMRLFTVYMDPFSQTGSCKERASGFIALGEMAGALDGELINYLLTISSHLRDAIAPRRGRPSLEALACVGNIAKAMGPTMEPHVRGLLDSIFSGLSLTLVEALEQITESTPPLLPTIQNRLLEFISTILSRSHYLIHWLITS
ncbi:Serine/threonine-protein kinase TOR [Capsicum baccatum]|uniref:Serine/threonine-protein kinase TOR n=1 Tax=Capsicum baccatum TaxID=33114 RepID=A0A2G2UZS5_CAPBA|nr:Serine/threonine-protein kinase TOR [Capsicum baccatum]